VIGRNRQPRTSLLRQLGVVAVAFMIGEIVSTRLLPAGTSFTVRLVVFLVLYFAAYIALWRFSEGLRQRQEADRRR
jgi:membrane protein implicated in regulation of membrane protease activity